MTDTTICPWHDESTPSLVIDKENNSFRCLGCGKEGDLDMLRAKLAPVSEQCDNCLYFKVSITRLYHGLCRRRPPVIIGEADPALAAWPGVNWEDWCGEWQKDKEAPEGA
jgi:hypothetical protein